MTATLPAGALAPAERQTQRFERMVQEEASREISQDAQAKQREELSREEMGASLVEAHETNDRFVRLLESEDETTKANRAVLSRRSTVQLAAPPPRAVAEQTKRPTLGDFLRDIPKDMPRRAFKSAYDKFAAEERAFDDKRNLAYRTIPRRRIKNAESGIDDASLSSNKDGHKH